MTALARDVFGVSFQNPLLLASGTAGYGRELEGIIELDRLGGIVTKAVSLAPRDGNAAPRVAEYPGGMLNSVGLANPGVQSVRTRELPWLLQRLHRARVVANIVGFTIGEYAEVIRLLDDLEGIAAFEVNLSCPNTSAGGIEFGADRESVQQIVSSCRAATRRALVAKLSPVLPDIAGMALAARDAGADGITVVNTIPGRLADTAGAPRLGNVTGGVSGPSLLPIGVNAVARIAERTGGTLPIMGVGGVRNADDVRQYLRAGASLVQVGTAAFAHPRIPERIIDDLERNGG